MNDENLLQIVRGDDEAIEMVFTDIDGSALDITGFTVRFTVDKNKNRANDDTVMFKKDITTHSDPTNGKTTIEISNADFASDKLKVGKYFYDIQYTDLSGKRKTPVIGVFEVIEDVTKRT